jgi:hypothetical protein
VFEQLILERLPDVHARLQAVGILGMLSLPWFITIFLSVMPFQSAAHILDCFFYDGARVLFQVGLQVLFVNREALLASADDCTAVGLLTAFLSGVCNTDTTSTTKAAKVAMMSLSIPCSIALSTEASTPLLPNTSPLTSPPP